MTLKPSELKQPQEHRIKVALKQKQKPIKKSATVKNKIKPKQKIPPMPKGKQLKKLAQTPKIKKIVKKQIKATPSKKTFQKKPVKKQVQTKKPSYNKVQKIVQKETNATKIPKKKTGLYALLSKKQKSKPVKREQTRSGSHIGNDFKEAYGEAFGKLSEGEKKYVIDNQEVMRRITQEQLNRLAPVNIPRNLNVNTSNVIEFYLHPNGDMSDLKLVNASGYEILDDTSLQTIEYSVHRYPLPKQKTLIRYKVGYYLGGRRH
ncbi:energy transducer TonB [Sulfurimonas sp. MAG313]|nr:energy transducer TonB [Sulfurimonas sp. MAG313]